MPSSLSECEQQDALFVAFQEATSALALASERLAKVTETTRSHNQFEAVHQEVMEAFRRCADAREALQSHRLLHGC